MEPTMYCSDCGALNPGNATYCLQCGRLMPGQPGAPPPPKPDNYLIWAVLSAMLCCMPFGVVSIIYAAQVDSRYAARDYAGAEEASASAWKWCKVSALTQLVGGGLYIAFWLVMAFGFHIFGNQPGR